VPSWASSADRPTRGDVIRQIESARIAELTPPTTSKTSTGSARPLTLTGPIARGDEGTVERHRAVVAERTPVQYVPPLALLALVLVVPLSVLVANVLAAFPGQRAVRQRIGAVLRAE